MMLLAVLLDAPISGASRRYPRVIHAIDGAQIVNAWPDRTVAAVCGAKRLRLLVKDEMALPWPPALKGLDLLEGGGRERCRECWVETGKMRPRWRVRETVDSLSQNR